MINKMLSFFKILFHYCLNMIFGFAFFAFLINETLPDIKSAQAMKRNPYVKIYDRKNNFLAQYGDIQECIISTKDLPTHLVHAILDVEDKSFFKHKGIDLLAIIRSFILNLLSNRIVGGGSTITQQLAKNILQNEEQIGIYDKTILRKIKELCLAIKLERTYTKPEILTFYLNRIYFGAACYGIYSASITYFSKRPQDLNLYESAALVGLVQAPSKFSKHANSWRKRTKHVLTRMYKNKHISKQALGEFEKFEIIPKRNFGIFMHFGDYIINKIPEQFRHRDLIIKTTLDTTTQHFAHEALTKAYEEYGQEWGANQGAMIVIDKNGQIKAMIGSLNYREHQFNIAVNAKRSLGSFFKYYIYLEAIRQFINPESFIDDHPVSIGAWQPSNYLHKSMGKIKVKDAFAQSVNASAVILLYACGINKVINLVHSLGIKRYIKANPSIALGGMDASLLEATSTLIPIVSSGYKIDPYGIQEIHDANTNELLYKHEPHFEKVIDSRTVWYMWNILKYAVTNGSSRKLNIPNMIVGAKTGTSNDYRDLVIGGATPEYVFGAWFGHTAFKPLNRVPGQHLSALACRYFLEKMPPITKDIETDFNFAVNTKSFEDLMSL